MTHFHIHQHIAITDYVAKTSLRHHRCLKVKSSWMTVKTLRLTP
jgi:hypothetical protein